MPNLISQMRNGMQPQQQQTQLPLNNSIQQVKGMMGMLSRAKNPQQLLTQLMQSNPQMAQIGQMMRSGGSLQGIAQQMAQQRGIDLNQLIQQLQS